jgi:hypothetical protein
VAARQNCQDAEWKQFLAFEQAAIWKWSYCDVHTILLDLIQETHRSILDKLDVHLWPAAVEFRY